MRTTGTLLAILSTTLLVVGCRASEPACSHLCTPSAPTRLERIAGQPGGAGHVDGALTQAHFRGPWQLVCDGAAHVYVTEEGSEIIRAVDLAKGQVTTLAGSPNLVGSHDGIGAEATFHGPAGLALAGGRLYIADVEHHLLRVLDLATSRVTTYAGKASVMGAKDGALADALFNEPEGLAIDGDDLYVGDTDNNVIRRISLHDGRVSTVAGAATQAGKLDGIGAQARFYKPMSITSDGLGHLYVCDTLNDRIRTVRLADGAVTTLATLPATPLGLGVVGADLIVSLANHQIVRIDRKSGAVRPWLGAAGQEGFADAANGRDARFTRPAGVCLDGAGHLIVADSGNQLLRSVTLASGEVRTLAGARSAGASDGTRDAARFSAPLGLAWDRSGSYYVADTANHTVRKVDLASGEVSTVAGSAGQVGAGDGIGGDARFNHPQGLALDGAGHLFVADSDNRSIRRIDLATRAVTTLALTFGGGLRLRSPTGLTFGDGALFVSDYAAHVVLRVDPAAQRGTLVAGKPATPGQEDGGGGAARFNQPESLASDGRGNLYVADLGNSAIRRIAIGSGAVSTVAGGRLRAGFGHDPPFNYPTHVAANGLGDLFVSDSNNNVIRRVELKSGRVTTLVGSWSDAGVRLGPLPAQLDHPSAIALSDDGQLAFFSENALLVAR